MSGSVKPSPKKRALRPHYEKPDYSDVMTAAKLVGALHGGTGKGDPVFLSACDSQGVTPTKRQARKYLAKTGRWATNRRVAS